MSMAISENAISPNWNTLTDWVPIEPFTELIGIHSFSHIPKFWDDVFHSMFFQRIGLRMVRNGHQMIEAYYVMELLRKTFEVNWKIPSNLICLGSPKLPVYFRGAPTKSRVDIDVAEYRPMNFENFFTTTTIYRLPKSTSGNGPRIYVENSSKGLTYRWWIASSSQLTGLNFWRTPH